MEIVEIVWGEAFTFFWKIQRNPCCVFKRMLRESLQWLTTTFITMLVVIDEEEAIEAGRTFPGYDDLPHVQEEPALPTLPTKVTRRKILNNWWSFLASPLKKVSISARAGYHFQHIVHQTLLNCYLKRMTTIWTKQWLSCAPWQVSCVCVLVIKSCWSQGLNLLTILMTKRPNMKISKQVWTWMYPIVIIVLVCSLFSY